MDKLLPCPFCGGEANLVKRVFKTGFYPSGGTYYVHCKSCMIATQPRNKKDVVVTVWNSRDQPENKPLTCEGCQDEPYDKDGRYLLGKYNICYGCRRNPNTKDAYHLKPEEVQQL